jgi:hypothetical protein
LDLAAAEAAAAAGQKVTDAAFLETNKAEIIPTDTAIQAEFSVTGTAVVSGSGTGSILYNPMPGYASRQRLTVDTSSVVGSHSNFPVPIKLTSNVALAAYAKADGSDIRFTNLSGEPIGFDLEYFNQSTGELKGFVNAASLDSSVVFQVLMWCGSQRKACDVAASDGYVASYKNVPQSLTDTPIFPHALRFTGTYDRTYVVYIDEHCNPTIVFYDHDTGFWSDPVQVLVADPQDDGHTAAALAIDANGYLFVCGGCYQTPLRIRRSINPESIATWGNEVEVSASQSTYANLFFCGTDLYVYWRSNSSWCRKISTDGGLTWASDKLAMNSSSYAVYPRFWRGGQSPTPYIYTAFLVTDGTIYKDVYFAYSDDGGTAWRKADGTLITSNSQTAPVNETNADLVYANDHIHGWIQDLTTDADGYPTILFCLGDETLDSINMLKVAKWTGVAWSINDVGEVNNRYCYGSLRRLSDGSFEVYAPDGGDANGNVSGATYGGEIIRKWTSADGETWIEAGDVVHGIEVKSNVTSVLNATTLLPIEDSDVEILWGAGETNPGRVESWGSTKHLSPILRAYDNNYVMVLNFSETSGQHRSATETAKRTAAVSVTSQGLNQTDVFNGSSNYAMIRRSHKFGLTVTTIEARISKPVPGGTSLRAILGHENPSTSDAYVSYIFYARDNGTLGMKIGNGSAAQTAGGSSTLSANTMTSVAGVIDGTHIGLYQNGNLDAGGLIAQTKTPINNLLNLYVGKYKLTGGADSGYFGGTMEYVRMSSVVHSADWIKTVALFDADPASFITVDDDVVYAGFVPGVVEEGVICNY